MHCGVILPPCVHSLRRFRPENNQVGFIAPTAAEAVADLLTQVEKRRVDESLKLYISHEPFTPTTPVGPRLGPVRETNDGEAKARLRKNRSPHTARVRKNRSPRSAAEQASALSP